MTQNLTKGRRPSGSLYCLPTAHGSCIPVQRLSLGVEGIILGPSASIRENLRREPGAVTVSSALLLPFNFLRVTVSIKPRAAVTVQDGYICCDTFFPNIYGQSLIEPRQAYNFPWSSRITLFDPLFLELGVLVWVHILDLYSAG